MLQAQVSMTTYLLELDLLDPNRLWGGRRKDNMTCERKRV